MPPILRIAPPVSPSLSNYRRRTGCHLQSHLPCSRPQQLAVYHAPNHFLKVRPPFGGGFSHGPTVVRRAHLSHRNRAVLTSHPHPESGALPLHSMLRHQPPDSWWVGATWPAEPHSQTPTRPGRNGPAPVFPAWMLPCLHMQSLLHGECREPIPQWTPGVSFFGLRAEF